MWFVWSVIDWLNGCHFFMSRVCLFKLYHIFILRQLWINEVFGLKPPPKRSRVWAIIFSHIFSFSQYKEKLCDKAPKRHLILISFSLYFLCLELLLPCFLPWASLLLKAPGRPCLRQQAPRLTSSLAATSPPVATHPSSSSPQVGHRHLSSPIVQAISRI